MKMNSEQRTTKNGWVCVLLLLCALLICLSGSLAQDIPVTTKQAILKAQDSRDAEALREYFGDVSGSVRERAVLAAASVQDVVHITPLSMLLDDVAPEVREGAALALGQMTAVVDSVQRRRISDQLIKRLAAEQDEFVSVRIAEALGKVGDAASLPALLQRAGQGNSTTLEWEVALSVGRYAYRGIKATSAVTYAVRLLDGPDSPDKWKAAYALMRIGDRSLLAEHANSIAAAGKSQDPNVKMFVASALGKLLDNKTAQMALLKIMESELDWRVKVNAIKALGNADPAAMSIAGGTVMQAAKDRNENISLTALTTLRSMKLNDYDIEGLVRPILTNVVENDEGTFSERQQKEAAVTLAKLTGVRSFNFLREKSQQGILIIKSYAEALGFIPMDEARSELFAFVKSPDAQTQRIVLEAIMNSCRVSPVSSESIERGRAAMQKALSSNDLAVLTTAAEALGDSLFADKSSAAELLSSLQRLKSPNDVEPMVSIIKSLGTLKHQTAVPMLTSFLSDPDRTVAEAAAEALDQLTGSPHKHLVAAHSKSLHANYDWGLLDRVMKNPNVKVRTSRGEFTIRMIPDEAPFTCINFATLIDKKFFDGLLFHRVVPNFVVQGGDPRGDGWGGPGYAIRSEFGYAPYDRGFVGVASSGKDTEGCQFFVTQSKQPHLDGRYTIFGKVTSGMGVIDALQVGDKIESILLLTSSEHGGMK